MKININNDYKLNNNNNSLSGSNNLSMNSSGSNNVDNSDDPDVDSVTSSQYDDAVEVGGQLGNAMDNNNECIRRRRELMELWLNSNNNDEKLILVQQIAAINQDIRQHCNTIINLATELDRQNAPIHAYVIEQKLRRISGILACDQRLQNMNIPENHPNRVYYRQIMKEERKELITRVFNQYIENARTQADRDIATKELRKLR